MTTWTHPANRRQHVPEDPEVARALFSWALPTVTSALGREPYASGQAEWTWRTSRLILVLEEFPPTQYGLIPPAAQLLAWCGRIPEPHTYYPCNLILDGTAVFDGHRFIIWRVPADIRTWTAPLPVGADAKALQTAISWFEMNA